MIKEPCPSLLSQMGWLLLQKTHGMCTGGRDRGGKMVNLEKEILQFIVPRENKISI